MSTNGGLFLQVPSYSSTQMKDKSTGSSTSTKKMEQTVRTASSLWSDDDSVTSSLRLGGDEDIQKHSMNIEETTRRTKGVALLSVFVGSLASILFLYMGIHSNKDKQHEHFRGDARHVVQEIHSSWSDYERSALWMHESCRDWRAKDNDMGLRDFEILYDYLVEGDLEIYAVQWVPNITHDERPLIEAQGEIDWGHVPGVYYQGIVGLEPDPDNPEELVDAPRSEQPFYFPVHFGWPQENLKQAAHYDLFSSPWQRSSIERALDTWKPSMSPPVRMLDQAEDDGFSVLLFHPGTPLPPKFHANPRDLASMIINVNALLARALRFQEHSLAVYLYDSTLHAMDEAIEPQFMAGEEINATKGSMIVLEEANRTALQEEYYLYFEQEFELAGRLWTVAVVPVDASYKPSIMLVILTAGIVFLGSVFVAMWMHNNLQATIEKHRVITKAAAEASIVSNMFPANVRERMIQEALANQRLGRSAKLRCALENVDDSQHEALTSESIFGSRPIADLHPYTTIMVADIDGFTAWSSQRDPSQVFTLLELLFHSFDNLAKKRKVYKVEVSGDIYVAVAGLPEPVKEHAMVMSRFATSCCRQMQTMCRALSKTLGPDTDELGIRIGLHSGQVVGGVLRGDKGRFQLFGDTLNFATKCAKLGERNKIHISQETAEELKESGRGAWVVAREQKVTILGKGSVQTYYLKMKKDEAMGSDSFSPTNHSRMTVSSRHNARLERERKTKRLVEWNVQVLCGLLKRIIARREAQMDGDCIAAAREPQEMCWEGILVQPVKNTEMVLDEVADIICLPSFNECAVRRQVDPGSIQLDPDVVQHIHALVTKIASMYRDNPFHSFEHACHVVMSVVKMMDRIVDPKEIAAKRIKGEIQSRQFDLELHDHTFGITSDPLTQFACAFSALIHDLDHLGVSNMILINEKHPLSFKYKNKSIAEQNSVELAWDLLMDPSHEKLRSCICATKEEFTRFRSLVVNSVMATDIMDKELQAARKERWNLAFSEENIREESEQVTINRKATIVIEHLIQASDISHTMQHWNVYIKWNELFFMELYKAYKQGRMDKDPSLCWYQGELGFFDFYIIPLAKKLFTCGVFGVSSDEFLNYALTNRKEWESKGAEMVQQYLANYKHKFEDPVKNRTNSMTFVSERRRSSLGTTEQQANDTADETSDATAVDDTPLENFCSEQLTLDSGHLPLPELDPFLEDFSKTGDDAFPFGEVFLDEIPETDESEVASFAEDMHRQEAGLQDVELGQPNTTESSLRSERSFMTAQSSAI